LRESQLHASPSSLRQPLTKNKIQTKAESIEATKRHFKAFFAVIMA
jgi:hypothetical protein